MKSRRRSRLSLSHHEDVIPVLLPGSGFNTRWTNVIFFVPHTKWPWVLYITSWTHLKALHYCLPHACRLLLVEWMSSSLTPVWAMNGLFIPKYMWHTNTRTIFFNKVKQNHKRKPFSCYKCLHILKGNVKWSWYIWQTLEVGFRTEHLFLHGGQILKGWSLQKSPQLINVLRTVKPRGATSGCEHPRSSLQLGVKNNIILLYNTISIIVNSNNNNTNTKNGLFIKMLNFIIIKCIIIYY